MRISNHRIQDPGEWKQIEEWFKQSEFFFSGIKKIFKNEIWNQRKASFQQKSYERQTNSGKWPKQTNGLRAKNVLTKELVFAIGHEQMLRFSQNLHSKQPFQQSTKGKLFKAESKLLYERRNRILGSEPKQAVIRKASSQLIRASRWRDWTWWNKIVWNEVNRMEPSICRKRG